MSVDIKVNADTSGAIASLEQLGTKVEGLQKKFGENIGKMTAAAAALSASLIAAGHEALAFADDITDLAAANQLAVGEVLALSEALAQNGGKAENAGRMLQTLANNMDAVNGGNLKTLKSFTDLGVSIKDLGNLTQTELRDKVIDALAGIEDPMERNAKAMAMFGKAAIGVDWKKFAEDQKQGREEQEKFAPALKTAGDAADRLGLIMERTKVAFAQAFEPVFKIISNLNPSVDDLTTKFRVMGAVLAVLTAGATVGAVLKLVEAFKLLGLVISRNPLVAVASAALGLATYFGLGASKADDLSKATDGIGESTDKVKRNQDDLNKALADEKDKLSKIGRELQNNFDIVLRKYQQEKTNLSLSEDQKAVAEAIAKVDEDALAAKKKAQEEYNSMSLDAQARQKQNLAEELKGIDDRAAKQKKAIQEQIRDNKAYYDALISFNKDAQVFMDAYKARFDALSKEKLDSSTWQERIGLEQKINEVTGIRAALNERVNKISVVGQYDAIQAIREATKDVSLLDQGYSEIGTTILDNLQKSQYFSKLSQADRDTLVANIKTNIEGIGVTAEGTAKTLQGIAERSQSFSAGWTKAFNDYVTNASNAANAAAGIFNKFSSGIEDYFIGRLEGLSGGWKKFLKSMAEEIARSQIKQLLAKLFTGLGFGSLFGSAAGGIAGGARGQTESSPIFTKEVGTLNKLDEMRKKLKEEAGMGAPAGTTPGEGGIWESIKTTISDFADSVGSFMSSMFSGLGNMISSMVSGIGSIISQIGGTLFDVVSTIGGTLWDVISSLGSGLGDILGGLGGGGGGGFLSDAISAVASFFGFANGGVIPTNGPVLVGEKGPELLFGNQGAAVVPLDQMGGATNITYNINAVDAMSFKQMIAQDPTFLYAVTMQGAKGMPVRR